MNRESLSKYMSYLLRHNPASIGLHLDHGGFVNLDELLIAINSQSAEHVTREQIVEVLQRSDRNRFEIVRNRIRALYGHTINAKIVHEPVVPPQILYHGTSRRNLQSILREGIKPMRRQFVHLSPTVEDAINVGLRKDAQPIILRVRAHESYRNGVTFYKAGSVFLSEPIPPEFVEVHSGS